MEYIIDASIVAQYVIDDTYSSHVDRLFEFKAQAHNSFIVPEICFAEVTNVLWKYVRFQGMSIADAQGQILNLSVLPLTVMPIVGVLQRALTIGLAHQLAVYDSLYIALAETRNIPLITVDRRQANAAQAVGVTLKPITDFV